ncbi:MAG: SDR family oxidoreductase [Prolixibacteraceae bacterium]|jgi:NAD(P)-dependent dehydrogenase (short-subunit alcohol dehydrogenase family)|nr:SDR family oxidoreductase [Prolixibacteraceae bacterium]
MDRTRQLFSLEGLRIVVTGASSGLGLNMSIMLAECGATVFGLSRSGQPKAAGMAKLPLSLTFGKLDVTKEPDVREKFAEIGGNGGIDVLVNNAGINLKKKAEEVTGREWAEVFDVNLNGLYACCKYAFPYLKQSEHTGRIINITSMASHLGFSEILPYTSSKSAVLGLTRSLAVEWAQQNILVNSVSPGWFPSELNRKVIDRERKKKILARMPLHRFGKPEELSPMICFLASSAATYITGQDFCVDGGALAFGY